MNRLREIRIPFFVACLAVLAAGPRAQADDPMDDFPTPAEAPAEAPAAAPAAPAAAAPATPTTPTTAWSAPAVTPGAGSALGALPPPQVVRRRGSMPPRAPMPAPRAQDAPASPGDETYVRDVPALRPPPQAATPSAPTGTPPASWAMPPPPPPPPPLPDGTPDAMPGTPMPGTPMPATSMPGAGASPKPTTAVGVEGNRVYGVAKSHNVELTVPVAAGSNDVAIRELALRLDVDYELRGQAGRDVYVAAWFARAETGALLTAGLPAYADGQGHVTLQTRSARVTGDASRFLATMQIPYRAFPVSTGEDAYDVEARLQVLRDEGGGRVTVLCSGATTFRVYGYAEPATLTER